MPELSNVEGCQRKQGPEFTMNMAEGDVFGRKSKARTYISTS